MEQILALYYADNAKKLHHMVDKLIAKFGGLSEKDMDDFYSLANEVFVDAMKRYDGSQPFDGLLYACLLNRIKTEITKRNREKRRADRLSVSIDALVDEEENITLGELLADSFDVEEIVFEKNEAGYSSRMLSYLDRLSGTQREMLKLMSVGYLPNEIKRKLHLNEKQYADCSAAIRSYRNVSVLLH